MMAEFLDIRRKSGGISEGLEILKDTGLCQMWMFETLLSGEVVQVPIREDLPYDIANSTEDNLWSILYLTGYLTQVLPEQLSDGIEPVKGKMVLRIPNEEVESVFAVRLGSGLKTRLYQGIAAVSFRHGGQYFVIERRFWEKSIG